MHESELETDRPAVTPDTGQAGSAAAVAPASASGDSRPICEIIAEIAADIPDEELDQFPTDLSERLDYYLSVNKRGVQD